MVSIDTRRSLASLGRPAVPGAPVAQPRDARVILVGCWSKAGKVIRLDQGRINGVPVDVAVIKLDDGTEDQRDLSEAMELEGGLLVWRF